MPVVRFKGFTDDWEQRELGEVIHTMYNGQTPSRSNDLFWKGNVNWLSSGELNKSIVTSTVEKISDSGKIASHLKLIKSGTLVIAITGLEAAGTRGNCAILGIDTTLNQSCMALIPNSKLDTHFLFQWYLKYGDEYGIRYTQGTKQQSYNAEILKKLPIAIPSIEEQKHIERILSKIDSVITLYQEQKDKLTLLQRMLINSSLTFNKEVKPLLSFSKFQEKWINSTINDVTSERSEKNSEGQLLSVTIRSGVVKSNTLNRKDNSSQNKSNYKTVKSGDIAYNSMRMWQGASGVSNYNGIVSPAYTVITPDELKVRSHFIAILFRTHQMKWTFQTHSQGLTSDTWNLKYPLLSKINITIPDVQTQKQIEQMEKATRELITQNEEKIKHLERVKTFLLSKLFI